MSYLFGKYDIFSTRNLFRGTDALLVGKYNKNVYVQNLILH